MDIVKTKIVKQLSLWHKLILLLAVILIVAVIYQRSSQVGVSVSRSNIIIADVRQGALAITVTGYGELKSAQQQLLTAKTSATVQAILLKPGAIVTSDSVIVQLANPALEQQLESAQQELNKLNANLRQLRLNNTRELLNERSYVAQSHAAYENAKLKLKAETSLVEQGIVSTLNYQRSRLDEQQLREQLAIAKQRAEQLKAVHIEAENIQLEQIKQQQGLVAMAQTQLANLSVLAGMDGILQRLPVELGQSVNAGQEIALIGSVDSLIAIIQVPQNQVDDIRLGQLAEVDTRRGIVMAKVARISPVVSNNTVEIELSLPKELPENVRPQLTVDANIKVAQLKNVAYIERPANVTSHSVRELYQVNSQQQSARLVDIKFGREAGRFIEILSGAQLDQQLIISDLTNLTRSNSEILIN
ncbi:MAG: efflux RND transporter periplasmic adaptor subunit [Pseudoalteromonas prydzensis]|uniref:efflux RND transporter periplasmic adaptor subunit n=1 Tax=Pseudoalteromonas prydzensis TaxID=182141 RepID=UPI003F95E33B